MASPLPTPATPSTPATTPLSSVPTCLVQNSRARTGLILSPHHQATWPSPPEEAQHGLSSMLLNKLSLLRSHTESATSPHRLEGLPQSPRQLRILATLRLIPLS